MKGGKGCRLLTECNLDTGSKQQQQSDKDANTAHASKAISRKYVVIFAIIASYSFLGGQAYIFNFCCSSAAQKLRSPT